MSTLGEELILNGVGFRIVSRDGWIWNHGELRNLTIVRSGPEKIPAIFVLTFGSS
jgi:hypothetical protein